MRFDLIRTARSLTQEAIAREVGCHQSTVSRPIAEYEDTRPLARKHLEAKALDMARKLATDAKPETILWFLARLDVVRDDDSVVNYGVQVIVGTPGQPAGPDPLDQLEPLRRLGDTIAR